MTLSKPLSSWAAVTGNWELGDRRAEYLGSPASARGILLGHSRLRNGTVKAVVALSEEADGGGVLLGYTSPNSRQIIVGLGGHGEAYVVSEFEPSLGLIRLDGAGIRANLQPERPYQVEVQIDGQRLRLTVEGIRVLTHIFPQPLSAGQIGLSAWGNGRVEFSNVEVSARPPTAFVVMQFGSPYDELFDEVIGPVCRRLDVKAFRASDIYRPSVILQDIIQGLADSEVVVAEITPTNANVFYELGYAHALGKPVILLAEEGTRLPFDLSGYRVIFYKDAIRGKSGLEADLYQHLSNILNE